VASDDYGCPINKQEFVTEANSATTETTRMPVFVPVADEKLKLAASNWNLLAAMMPDVEEWIALKDAAIAWRKAEQLLEEHPEYFDSPGYDVQYEIYETILTRIGAKIGEAKP
jgi:hypothetical protein